MNVTVVLVTFAAQPSIENDILLSQFRPKVVLTPKMLRLSHVCILVDIVALGLLRPTWC